MMIILSSGQQCLALCLLFLPLLLSISLWSLYLSRHLQFRWCRPLCVDQQDLVDHLLVSPRLGISRACRQPRRLWRNQKRPVIDSANRVFERVAPHVDATGHTRLVLNLECLHPARLPHLVFLLPRPGLPCPLVCLLLLRMNWHFSWGA